MTDTQIKHMVNRFLGWRLPEDFNPDGGISFKRTHSEGTPFQGQHQPSGTNLFSATQAEAMIRHLVEGIESSEVEQLRQENAFLLETGNGLVGRINRALRVLAGPSPLEEAVAGNRRALGLPPQCEVCDSVLGPEGEPQDAEPELA